MWQTIQLLLGPDEHSAFLREAVQKWDVKDPDTGEAFLKVLPRACFPPAPDSHMMSWYEGVSERLRREAEEDEKVRITAAEDDRPDTPNDGANKHHRRITRHAHESEAEESSPDSKGGALAYFRNPLFRTVDGRPGVVRRGSRRPQIKQQNSGSFITRGKTVASAVGNVVKNVGSPHLWDGHATKEKEKERDHRRRRSLPDKHRFDSNNGHDSAPSSPPGLHPRYHEHHRRRDSSLSNSDRSWELDTSPRHSPAPHHRHHTHHSDSGPRARRSHDAEPSPREYFPPYNNDDDASASRRNSAQFLDPRATSPSQAGFVPSQSPLFATQVARGDVSGGAFRAQSRSRMPPPAGVSGAALPPQRSSSLRYEGRKDSKRDRERERDRERGKQTRFEMGGDGSGRRYGNEGSSGRR